MTNRKIDTVMIIDDDEIVHLLYKRMIKRSDKVNKVISFTYAEQALEFLKQKDCEVIDVILLDINMPRMDGFEFLAAATKELGSSFANSVIVMLTTSLASEDVERASQLNIIDAYVNKPLTEAVIDSIADGTIYGPDHNLIVDPQSKAG